MSFIGFTGRTVRSLGMSWKGYLMKLRIAMWAGAGLLVAGIWAVYAAVTSPPPLTFGSPIMPLVELTCPIALASARLHVGISLYWALVANAATYALFGLMMEAVRTRLRHSH